MKYKILPLDEDNSSDLPGKTGNEQDFAALFRSRFAELFAFAKSMLVDKNHPSAQEMQSACNITVEVFFLLWAKRNDLYDAKDINAFLHTTLRNNAINFLKYRQKFPFVLTYEKSYVFPVTLSEGICLELEQMPTAV